MISASIPTLGPILKHIRNKSGTKFTFPSNSKNNSSSLSAAETAVSRHSSLGDAQIQKNLAHALGIHMPGLGNTVVISGGKDRLKSKGSRDSVLPLSDIKATTRTDVKVEPVPAYSMTSGGEEDVEKLFSMPKVLSRDGSSSSGK